MKMDVGRGQKGTPGVHTFLSSLLGKVYLAIYSHQSTQRCRKAWKIGNDIHTVACGSLTQLHMRPYQAILCVADHKYAHT